MAIIPKCTFKEKRETTKDVADGSKKRRVVSAETSSDINQMKVLNENESVAYVLWLCVYILLKYLILKCKLIKMHTILHYIVHFVNCFSV